MGRANNHKNLLIRNENASAQPSLDRAPRDTQGHGEFNAGRVARATKHGARAISAGLPCQADQSKSARSLDRGLSRYANTLMKGMNDVILTEAVEIC